MQARVHKVNKRGEVALQEAAGILDMRAAIRDAAVKMLKPRILRDGLKLKVTRLN